jgi:hypothetical protein
MALPAAVRHELEHALESAELKGCGVDEAAQEAMRLYLDTWVAGRIRRVLEWDEGRLEARNLKLY